MTDPALPVPRANILEALVRNRSHEIFNGMDHHKMVNPRTGDTPASGRTAKLQVVVPRKFAGNQITGAVIDGITRCEQYGRGG